MRFIPSVLSKRENEEDGAAVLPRRLLCGLILTFGWVGGAHAAEPAKGMEAGHRLVYVGTYTAATSRGIYAFDFDERSGALAPLGLAAATPNPSFLALSRDGQLVYAVNESSHGAPGSVSAFRRRSSEGAALDPLGEQPSGGVSPCHLALDGTNRWLFVANFGSGSLAEFPLSPEGRILPAAALLADSGSGPRLPKQRSPHVHCAVLDPTGRFVLACDLGTDRVMVWRLDPETGRLRANDPPWAALPAGSGPRHLAFNPRGDRVYVVSELASTLAVFRWNPGKGSLDLLQVLPTLPPGTDGANAAAEVQVDASGRFVYVSNRGHGDVTWFKADEAGALSFAASFSCAGRLPRNFCLDPSGEFLLVALQDTNRIDVLRRNPATGGLTPTGHFAGISEPQCIIFAPVPPGL